MAHILALQLESDMLPNTGDSGRVSFSNKPLHFCGPGSMLWTDVVLTRLFSNGYNH